MTMALAVALAACTAATSVQGETGAQGPQGEQGPAGEPGTSDNEPPRIKAGKELPPLYVALAGSGETPGKMASFKLSDYFEDTETFTLDYKASVDDEDVATVDIKEGELIVTGKKAGPATVTVRVSDGTNSPVEFPVMVMVVASNVKPVVSALSIGANSDVLKLAAKLYMGRGASTVTVSSVIYDFGHTEGSTGDEPLTFEPAVGNAGGDDDIVSVSVASGSKPDTWDVTLAPKKAGHQNVVVTIKDKFGAEADTKWRFTVLVNTKPSEAISLPTRSVGFGGTADDAAEQIAIATYFTTAEKPATQPRVLNDATPPVMEAAGSWAATSSNTAGSVTHPDYIQDQSGGTGDEADAVEDNATRTNDVSCSYSTSPDQTVAATTTPDNGGAHDGSGSISVTSTADGTTGAITTAWTALQIPDGKVGEYELTIACRDAEGTAVSTATITVLP